MLALDLMMLGLSLLGRAGLAATADGWPALNPDEPLETLCLEAKGTDAKRGQATQSMR